jgi:hypothetical protein
MRYAIGILLLATPAFAGEPSYSWQSTPNDPSRVYLYLDGKQIGGWCYADKYYRPFDGQNWGPPTNTAPVRPPEQRALVITQPKPLVITPQIPPPLQMRGPVRVRLGTAMGQAIVDGSMNVIKEIPGAIAKSLAEGNYQLNVQSSVTRSEQQPNSQITPPGPVQPAVSPQRRWFFPRQ